MVVVKMIDNQITFEGLFTIVLYTYKNEVKPGIIEYGFKTNGDPESTVKSPFGMFDEKIPNDLKYVADRIKEYEGAEV